MYVLKIGRAYPNKETGMMGIFEFEQANALSNKNSNVVYVFCDTRSIKRLRKFGYYYKKSNNVYIYGCHLPIGGLPQKLFSRIKTRYYKKILNNIVEQKGVPDIIHIHYPLLTLTNEIWDLLKSYKRPIVVTEHWSKVQTKELDPFRIELLRKIVKESTEFICVGDILKKSVRELTKTEKNIKVIPNMVSPMFFYKESEFLSNSFNFIAVGRLIETKRFETLIDAFAKAFSEQENVKLTIVGGGPLYSKLKRKIESLGLSKQISMTGFITRSETAIKIKQSDAFVSASVLETFGVPFVEAMACGKPVIGVKGSSIDKYINKSNGILFERDNIEDLEKALIYMYKNIDSFNEKQIADQTYKIFSEESITNKLIGIYKNLI